MGDSQNGEYSEKMEAMLQSFINASRDSDSEPIENEDYELHGLSDGRGVYNDFASFESPSTSEDMPPHHVIPTAPVEPSWERGPTLFVMNVKVRDQRLPLEIHENDKPQDLAHEFCENHKLPDSVKSQLTSLIIQHRKEFIHEVIEPDPEEIFEPHPPKEPPPPTEMRGRSARGRRRKKRKRRKRRTRAPSLEGGLSDNDGMVEQFQSILSNHYKTMHITKKPKRRARSVPPRRRKKKGGRDRNVFNRLYKEHAKRKVKHELAVAEANLARHKKYSTRRVTLSKGSQRMISHRRPRGDVSDRLYGLAKKRKHDLKIKQKTRELEKAQIEIEEVTFQPAISKRAQSLNRCGSKLWKRIVDPMGHESRQAIHDLRERIIREEMERCPFRPKVNKNSAHLAERVRTGEDNVHQRLHNESAKQEQHIIEKTREINLKRKCTFQPKISERSKALARVRQPRPPSPRHKLRRGSIVLVLRLFESDCKTRLFRKGDRLRIFGSQDGCLLVNTLCRAWPSHAMINASDFSKLDLVDGIRKRNLRDPRTGQKLFHPRINKKSQELQKLKRQHVADYQNVGEYLHHEFLEEKEPSVPSNRHLTFSPKLCKKSRSIASRLVNKHHEDVWKAIAGKSESISINNIQNLSQLSPEDAMAVCHMLNELVDQNLISQGEPVIDFPKFCEKFAQFTEVNPQGPRHKIERDYVQAKPSTPPSFKPVLSPKAQQLERTPGDVFENLFAVAQEQREKRSEKVESKFEQAKKMLKKALRTAKREHTLSPEVLIFSTPKKC